MVAPILIPLAILGGMDGVEPLRASVPLCEKPNVIRREECLVGATAAGVREIARLTGYSPAHVCYARRKELNQAERLLAMRIWNEWHLREEW